MLEKRSRWPTSIVSTTGLLVPAIVLWGCSTTYSVGPGGKTETDYSYADMSEEIHERHVSIELLDGKEISVDDASIVGESLLWKDPEGTDTSKVPLRQIKRLVLKNHLIGGLEGLGFCAVGGGGIGGVADLTQKVSSWGTGARTGMGLLLGGAVGVVLGLPVGSMIGYRYIYEFR